MPARVSRLSALAAIASLLSACGGGLGSVPAATPQQHLSALPVIQTSHVMTLDGGIVAHVMFARDYQPAAQTSVAALARPASVSKLIWNGGKVQINPKIFIAYWGSKWTTSDPEYVALNGFMTKMAGGKWINVDTQYSGSNGKISNPSTQLDGVWIDTSSVPSHPGSSAVGAEAQKAALHFGFKGVNANYIVAIQSGNDPSGFKTQWCAWHSDESESEGVVSFTDLPYQSDAGANCGAGSVNSPGTYDGVSIVSGHEEAETQTDPRPSSGWTDVSGSAIGDKCAWVNLENNPNAGGYPTQPLWDNAISGCAQSGP